MGESIKYNMHKQYHKNVFLRKTLKYNAKQFMSGSFQNTLKWMKTNELTKPLAKQELVVETAAKIPKTIFSITFHYVIEKSVFRNCPNSHRRE